MGEKRCRHYELRIFPEKEPNTRFITLIMGSPILWPEIYKPKTTEFHYVVLKGDIARKIVKNIYGKSWIREQKTSDGIKYVCACCGQEFSKEDAGRMNQVVDKYVSGKGFYSGSIYSEMRRIKTLYWEDGKREKANFRTEEPAIICGPYDKADLFAMKLTDFFRSGDFSMEEISKIQFVKEDVPLTFGFLSGIPMPLNEEQKQEMEREFVWHETLGTFLRNKSSLTKSKGEKNYE